MNCATEGGGGGVGGVGGWGSAQVGDKAQRWGIKMV